MPLEQASLPDTCKCKAKAQRFAEYVRLHASEGGIISTEDEMSVLRTGVSDFGLGLDEAKGILFAVAADRGITLETQADRYLGHFLQQVGKKGKVTRKNFKDAAEFYKKLTNNALSEGDAKKRVKAMMERGGMKARRSWIRLGSRKWYNSV